MKVFRLAPSKHALDLSGEGAWLYGGRWNSVGTRALYASQSIALLCLNILCT